jgi:hypothetical protein
MTSILDFHPLAATRGEGLRPEFRALFESVVDAPRSELTARNDGVIQSGPEPVSAQVSKERGNVPVFPEQELTEEQFFEQFAALEDGLALLQIHMRGMSENAKRFGSLARHIRRSICPAAQSPR